MLIVVEGVDRVGKDTQIKNIKREFSKDGILFHEVHYTADIVKDMLPVGSFNASLKYYGDMFFLMKSMAYAGVSSVFNRAHLGEYVYAQKYRGYNGEYVFDLEKDALRQFKMISREIKLVVFVDDPERLVLREDGESLGKSIENKTEECDRFKTAFEMSNIKRKLLIDIRDKGPSEVWTEVEDFLKWGHR